MLTAIGLDQTRTGADDDDIHGAIRPSNVVVREEPEGISFKLTLDDDSDHPDRVAPEQVRGEPVGPRTDVYLTGQLLFEALTGHRPPRSAPVSASGVSPALEAVINRALADDPDQRFRWVPEMGLAATEAVHNPTEVSDTPHRASRPKPSPRTHHPGRSGRRSTERIVLSALAFLAPLAVVGALYGAIVLLQDDGGSGDEGDATTEQAAAPSAPATGGTPELEGQLELKPAPGAASGVQGLAGFARTGNKRQIVIQAQLKPRGQREAYEVWLYNSRSDAFSVGAQRPNADGVFQGAGALPDDYKRYRFVDISLEKLDNKREHSGRSVLRGKLADMQPATPR